tara:strand:- start:4046 stop:4804 length:759 start_codon:yes stop_codon:yes gene_type:complete
MESKIKIQSVHLDFPIYDYQSRSLRNKIKNYGINMRKEALNNKQNKKIVEALKNVSFNFSHGDRVGLLGPNGSGKTTLLKLIAGIYSPTSGIIKKTGDISCMLDIGFGFEQDATGYENIILSNITRGLTRKEIDKIIPEIADFSGLGEFLDMPIRTYSSGMQARLAFSSAVASSPDILLIDEFFSTGDIEFSQKSKKKVLEMMDNSSILVFASHDLDLISRICNKAVCMQNGEVCFTGNTIDTINFYKAKYN